MPDVNVTITSAETGISIHTKTNRAGYYRVVDLLPGAYRAHFEATGFATVGVTSIQVTAGQVRQIARSGAHA